MTIRATTVKAWSNEAPLFHLNNSSKRHSNHPEGLAKQELVFKNIAPFDHALTVVARIR
jgi:hypothetical protein